MRYQPRLSNVTAMERSAGLWERVALYGHNPVRCWIRLRLSVSLLTVLPLHDSSQPGPAGRWESSVNGRGCPVLSATGGLFTGEAKLEARPLRNFYPGVHRPPIPAISI